MRQTMPSLRPPIASQTTRNLPAGTGFVLAGLVSILFWGMVAGIAVIV